jgi:hypothetical protein
VKRAKYSGTVQPGFGIQTHNRENKVVTVVYEVRVQILSPISIGTIYSSGRPLTD